MKKERKRTLTKKTDSSRESLRYGTTAFLAHTVSVKIPALIVFLICVFASVTFAQQGQFDAKRGSQLGNSYAVGDFETINTTGGNLMLNFPLGSLPAGRGDIGGGISLFYNSKVYDKTIKKIKDERYPCTFDENGEEHCRYYYKTVYTPNIKGGWSYTLGYQLEFESRLNQFGGDLPNCRGSMQELLPNWQEMTYVNKLYVVFPDGSRHEMIPYGHNDALYDRYYRVRMDGILENCGGEPSQTARPVYYSVDGSYLRLESTSNSWTIYFNDGTKIVNTDGQPQRIYDRNNNYIEYLNNGSYDGRPATKVADQFGRTVTLVGRDETHPDDEIHTSGTDGEDLVWKVRWKTVSAQKYYQACSDSDINCPSTEFIGRLSESLVAVDKIIEPVQMGGREYVFQYNGADTLPASGQITNGLGVVSGITLPTGAQINYAYANDNLGTQQTPFENIIGEESAILTDSPVSKTLTYIQEYDGASAPVTETWLYSCSRFGGSVTSPDGSGTGTVAFNANSNNWDAGLVYKTSSSDGTVNEKIWAKNQPATCPQGNNSCSSQPNNPYVKSELTSIKDNSGNFVYTAIKDYSYDKNGNVTQVKIYDWVPYSSVPRASNGIVTGLPSGITPAQIISTAYYNDTPDAATLSTDSDTYIFSSSPPLKNRAKSVETSDGANQAVARSEMFYDNPATTGNLTETKSWDSSKGTYGNPLGTGNSISVTAQYNQYGMPILTTDARGVQTQITYGQVGSVTDLYPTQIKTAYGLPEQRTSASTYDFSTGLAKNVTDVDNNVTNETVYDATGRPVTQKAAVGTSNEVWTQTAYNDQLRRVIVKADLFAKGDAKKVSIQHFDQLGRVRLSRTLEDAATQSATDETQGIKVQTRYKYDNPSAPANSNGSYTLTSNPYRATTSSQASGEEAMGWTVAYKDKTGKQSMVKTYGGSSLPSPFVSSGANTNLTGTATIEIDTNITTVTDQAGKQRRSLMNGLGQLTRVDEPNDSGNLGSISSPNQATSYAYDALNNLTQVNQGVQTRTFQYDSLSRLKQAVNPESGAISYAYDNNGNLTSKTDARSVVTNYSYDNLNRVLTRTYSDSTPQVTYTYDDASIQFAKGRLTKVASSVSETKYNTFDNLGRVLASQQITDGGTYNFGYAYNLAGMLTEETYPSGRKVKNTIATDASLSKVESQPYGGAYATRADNFTYTSAGAVSSMQLGNGKWENANFNSRLQPTQLGLGTSASDQSLWKVNYDYGTTDNNGNVKQQTITVPSINPLIQTYTYDSLNRLKSAEETQSSSQTWKQTFTYDRYGNRNFDVSNTTTLGSCPATQCNPTVDTANNRFSSGQGYTYDQSGNVTADSQGRTFVYDAENKQKEVKDSSNNSIGQYLYDGDGKRVKKLSAQDTTVFAYDAAGKLAAEYLLTNSAANTPTTSYLTNDTLGSPRVITDQSGNVQSRRDFMPFGEEISGLGNRTQTIGYVDDSVRQKFTGYERDDETELNFAKTRMFSSGFGRFTSPDSFTNGTHVSDPQSWNLYVYVRNNPLNMIDPLGKKGTISYWTDSNGVVHVSLSATFAIYGAKGQNVSKRDLKEFKSQLLGGIRELLKATFKDVEGRKFEVSANVSAVIKNSETEAKKSGKDNIVEVGYQNLVGQGDDAAGGIAFSVKGEKFDRMAMEIKGQDGDYNGIGRFSDAIRKTAAHEFGAHLLSALHNLDDSKSLFYESDGGNGFLKSDFIRLMTGGDDLKAPPPLPGMPPSPDSKLGDTIKQSGRMERRANGNLQESPSSIYKWKPN